MKRLFGTDGIRGEAGRAPLDAPTVRCFGAALAEVLEERQNGSDGANGSNGGLRVVLGRDTRESGPWLRDAVARGLLSKGAVAVDAGVISTPGLATIVAGGDFAAGVMISASHNPFHDNGLKVFGPDGIKLDDESESQVERLILDESGGDPGDSAHTAPFEPQLVQSYVERLEQVIGGPGRLGGMRLLIDCANGSAAELAPTILRHYGAQVDAIGDRPDGRNINEGCGSLHLDVLQRRVPEGGYALGLAFDGDADRCLAVDARGRIVDGDYILYLCARALKRAGKLRGNAVVATIMSNYWLEDRLRASGIQLLRTKVGDKYVLQQMCEDDLVLGGEQSGHVIFRDHSTTGDGILTALMLLDTLLEESDSLEEIIDGIQPYPQVLLNVRVSDKPDLRAHPTIGPLVAEIEEALSGQGRVVLRYSGTEPVARVMIEGKDAAGVQSQAERLAERIASELS